MKRIARRRAPVLLTSLAVIAAGVLVAAPPASAATVGLAPSAGVPVEIVRTALRSDASTVDIVNNAAQAVHVVEVTAQTTDPDLETFEVTGIVAIDADFDVDPQGSFLARVEVYARHAGEHSGTLTICDRLVSEPDGASHCTISAVHVTAEPYGPPELTFSGPPVAAPGSAVTLTGTARSSDGTFAPLAGATVTVTRSSTAGEVAYPPVTTDVTGAFVVHATVGLTDSTFAAYVEAADFRPGTIWCVVTVPAASSTIRLTAPTTAARGSTIHVTGLLTSGGQPRPSQAVTVTTKTLQGTSTATVTTSASGTFSFDRTLVVGGDVTLIAAWAGAPGQAATSTTVHVTVPRKATAMTLAAGKKVYPYGAVATIRLHLGTTYNSRVVLLYERPLATIVGKPGNLIARATLGSTGDLVVKRTLTRRTTYTAVFAGDYRYAPVTRTVSPNVRSKLGVTMYRYTKRSGKYYGRP